jgi:type II secretory pathway predicted ATPase ExeA
MTSTDEGLHMRLRAHARGLHSSTAAVELLIAHGCWLHRNDFRDQFLFTMAALDQRIASRYSLPPMTGPETAGYLAHHTKLAGRADTLFSDDATNLIHTTGRGLPRAVNNLARQALLAQCH